jgi:hypothetical protein
LFSRTSKAVADEVIDSLKQHLYVDIQAVGREAGACRAVNAVRPHQGLGAMVAAAQSTPLQSRRRQIS